MLTGVMNINVKSYGLLSVFITNYLNWSPTGIINLCEVVEDVNPSKVTQMRIKSSIPEMIITIYIIVIIHPIIIIIYMIHVF